MQIEQQKVDTPQLPKSDIHQNKSVGISWKVHPFVENWRRTFLLMLFLASILGVLFYSFRSIVILLLSASLLIGPLYKYFLPFIYLCDIEKLTISACCYKIEKSWKTFRSYYVDKNGVLLSPFPKPTRLENFRGIYVRFGKHSPEQIVKFIDDRLNPELNDDPTKT